MIPNGPSPRGNAAAPAAPASSLRVGDRLTGIAAGPAAQPRKRRSHGAADRALETRIARLASAKTEFKGNFRRSAGFLSAFLELADLMGPELLIAAPGVAAPTGPGRF